MTVHHDQPRDLSGRRRWLRLLCATGVLGILAAFAFRGTAQEDNSSPSRFFRLPGLFRSNTEESSPAPPQTDGRLLRRVRQLMSDAQQLASLGHSAAALDMARRAESVLETAGRTTGVSWPAGERTPAEYVAALEQKARASTPIAAQVAAGRTLPGPAAPTRNVHTPQSPTAPGELMNAAGSSESAGFLLNWGDRAGGLVPQRPAQAEAARDGGSVQLATEGETQGYTEASASPGNAAQPAEQLLDRLRTLETWGTVGGLASDRNTDESQTGSPQMPAVGGWQREISDGQVGPIPTRPPEPMFEDLKPGLAEPAPPARLSVDGPTRPTETPDPAAVPDTDPFAEAGDAGDAEPVPAETDPAGPQPIVVAEPEPVPQAVSAAPEPTERIVVVERPSAPVDTKSASAETPLLMSAVVQVMATFVGVLLAILVFRAVAIRIWGPGMGLIVPVSQQDSVASEGDEEESGVVPFSTGSEEEAETEMQIPDPASVPFRLVGSTYEEERQAEEQAEKERDEAILKTVFEQNVDLIDELHGMRKSA